MGTTIESRQLAATSGDTLLPIAAPLDRPAVADSFGLGRNVAGWLGTQNGAATLSVAGLGLAALGTNLTTTWAAGYHHPGLGAPGISSAVAGTAITAAGQALAATTRADRAAFAIGWLGTQAGVILNQLGDSYYHAETQQIVRNHSWFLGGLVLAAAAGSLTLFEAMSQRAHPHRDVAGAALCAMTLIVGAGFGMTTYSAGSAADVASMRPVGLAVAVAGVIGCLIASARRSDNQFKAVALASQT